MYVTFPSGNFVFSLFQLMFTSLKQHFVREDLSNDCLFRTLDKSNEGKATQPNTSLYYFAKLIWHYIASCC